MTRRVDLNRWQPHIEEARRRGVSLKAYAAEQGVSLYSLYRASQALRAGAAVSEAVRTRRSSSKFAGVRVVTSAATTPLRVNALFVGAEISWTTISVIADQARLTDRFAFRER